MIIDQQKKQLRRQLMRENALHSQAEKKRISTEISQQIIEKIVVTNAQLIAAFIPTSNEVDISLVMNWLLSTKREVAIPYFSTDSNKMNFFVIDQVQQLEAGAFGILQPNPNGHLIPATELELILVPGVAFDWSGNRLGRGKGYYDHFLTSTSETCVKIGVCYPWQIVENIPNEFHDEKVNFVASFHSLSTFSNSSILKSVS